MGMGYNLRSQNRNQLMMLPPSYEELLPEDHLARTVVEVVEHFDLGAFYSSLRPDGRGGASYDPATLVAVVLGYSCYTLIHLLAPQADLGPTVGALPTGSVPIPTWADLASFGGLIGETTAFQVLIANALTLALLGTLDAL